MVEYISILKFKQNGDKYVLKYRRKISLEPKIKRKIPYIHNSSGRKELSYFSNRKT